MLILCCLISDHHKSSPKHFSEHNSSQKILNEAIGRTLVETWWFISCLKLSPFPHRHYYYADALDLNCLFSFFFPKMTLFRYPQMHKICALFIPDIRSPPEFPQTLQCPSFLKKLCNEALEGTLGENWWVLSTCLMIELKLIPLYIVGDGAEERSLCRKCISDTEVPRRSRAYLVGIAKGQNITIPFISQLVISSNAAKCFYDKIRHLVNQSISPRNMI